MSLLAVVVMTSGLMAEDVLVQPRVQPQRLIQPPRVVQPKPIRPIVQPVPVRTSWQLKVEEKSRYPEKQWAAKSAGASERGLSVTLQPELRQFASGSALAFRVTLTNTSDEPFGLTGGTQLGLVPKLVLVHTKTGAQWTVEGDFTKAKGQPRIDTLAAGTSIERTLVVDAPVFRRPVPLPGPRPQPIPKIGPVRDEALGADELPPAKKPPVVQPGPIVKPGRPIVVGQPFPLGAGTIRVRLLLEFRKADEKAKPANPVWWGRLASRPVDVTLTGPAVRPFPQPIPKPQPLPGVQPVPRIQPAIPIDG